MQAKTENKPTVDEQQAVIGIQKKSIVSIIMERNALFLLIILCIVSTIISPLFFTSGNIFNLLRQQSTYLVISIGYGLLST
jgi:inositol transport system permease protein